MNLSSEIVSANAENEVATSVTTDGEAPKPTNNRAGKRNYKGDDNLQLLQLIE